MPSSPNPPAAPISKPQLVRSKPKIPADQRKAIASLLDAGGATFWQLVRRTGVGPNDLFEAYQETVAERFQQTRMVEFQRGRSSMRPAPLAVIGRAA